MDERVEIKNRKDQKVIVLVDKIDNAKGLAFVMHGLGGFKEKTHIIAFKEAFKESGFTVVRFDTTCTLGESDGDYADATVTNYYQDLEDVIAWADSQEWYLEPFWICGHSLGGISVSLFAENFPEKVKGVAPISPVVSGKLSMETEKHKSIVEDWKKTGQSILPK